MDSTEKENTSVMFGIKIIHLHLKKKFLWVFADIVTLKFKIREIDIIFKIEREPSEMGGL